jgi:hypothetical protein
MHHSRATILKENRLLITLLLFNGPCFSGCLRRWGLRKLRAQAASKSPTPGL